MSARLSEELQQELAREGDRPIQVVHPGTQKMYVLLSAELFDRLRPLLDDSFHIRDTYAAQDAALSAIWSDPELDAYADYDRQKSQS